jgi:putative adenylate-forming enzyme
MMTDNVITAAHFINARWNLQFRDRTQLENWQRKKIEYFVRNILPNALFYRKLTPSKLADLPYMNKLLMMENFAGLNTRNVGLDEAYNIARQAEESRDFSTKLGDLTVGLSSGTSGNRGLFLVSDAERVRWAGILLARALPKKLLAQLILPWKKPLKIAFFLRANSNLYTTLSSHRISFTFHDLLQGVSPAVAKLNAALPDILVGPPSLLRALAREQHLGNLQIRPQHIISVADVLEGRDIEAIEETFGCKPHQLYQATEGFLAYTCEQGSLHLNETNVHFEREWLDRTYTRFQPVITDFSRHTQLIVRYKLNDILRIAEQPCSCGRAELTIAEIEGRADDIVWLPQKLTGKAVAIYPDFLRRAMIFAGSGISEYSITQFGMRIKIGIKFEEHQESLFSCLRSEFEKLWKHFLVTQPDLEFSTWEAPKPGAKRKRINIAHLPEGLSCPI